MDKKNYKTIFGIATILTGIILEAFNIGTSNYLGFASVGTWLIYVGIVSIAMTILQSFKAKEVKADERMYFVANKANRITFLAVIIISFIVMVWDGASKITISYSTFMSYFICAIVLIHLITYKALLNKY
jgi:uncharacterized membrane protein